MNWLVQIYRLTIVSLLYLFAKILLKIAALAGRLGFVDYQQSAVGTCIILAPATQMQIIKEGLDYLRNIDFGMFNRLTVQRKYIFWYHKKSTHSAYDIYTINDRYLAYGKEGVVICLVQAVLDRAMKDSLSRFQVKSYGSELQRGRQEIFEFIKKHSFSPQLVKQYQKLVEK